MKKTLLRKLVMPLAVVAGLAGCKDNPNFPSDGDAYKKVDGQHIRTEQGVFFSDEALYWLEKRGVPRDSSEAYDDDAKLTSPEAIPEWYNKGLTPGVYKNYNKRFDGFNSYLENDSEVLRSRKGAHDLYDHNIMPEVANQFDGMFNSREVIKFHEEGIPSEFANDISQFIRGEKYVRDVIDAFRAKLTPNLARDYGGNFGLAEKIELRKAQIGPSKAKKYYLDFNARDIMLLEEWRIPVEFSNACISLNREYGTKVSARDILNFRAEKVSYESLLEQAKKQNIRDRLEK